MKTTYENYISQAMRTNSNTVGTYNVHPDLIHSALGLSDEIVELEQAVEKFDSVNVVEEISDLFWFTALAAQAADMEFPEHTKAMAAKLSDEMPVLRDSINDYVSIIKRWYAYGKVPQEELTMSIENIYYNLCDTCYSIGMSPDYVMGININKLSVRYPDKFTPEAANNRDVIAERDALSDAQ